LVIFAPLGSTSPDSFLPDFIGTLGIRDGDKVAHSP
jgi:hypothetical protein